MRRVPRRWVREIVEVAFNRTQLLTFMVGVVGLALYLQHAGAAERDQQALSWAIGIEAFALGVVGWAIVSLIRAPFIVIHEDRVKGSWHGSRYIYREPQLIAAIRCKTTGAVERYKLTFPDAEPDAYVETFVTMTPDVRQHACYGIGQMMMLGLRGKHGNEVSRLNGYESCFYLELEEQYHSVTARVFCESFTVGEPDNKDGRPGEIGPEIRRIGDRYTVGGKPIGEV